LISRKVNKKALSSFFFSLFCSFQLLPHIPTFIPYIPMTNSNSDYSGFAFLALTADDPEPLLVKSYHEDHYHHHHHEDGEDDDNDDETITPDTTAYWVDDSLCQENLPAIITLTPDEATIDSTNHIHSDNIHLFFEELGYLTEEPEPLDPTRDYLAEYHVQLEQQQQRYKKSRRHHIDLDRIPSLLDDNETNTASGVSSSSSSFIHHHHHHHHHHHQTQQQQLQSVIRSPHFLGAGGGGDYDQPQPYAYGAAALWDSHHHHQQQHHTTHH
jgi:hypothetical protein